MLSRPFVRDHGLEIQHVPHRRVVERDAGRAQHVATIACDIERRADVVPLRQRDLRALAAPASLSFASRHAISCAPVELANGVREPRLDQLRVVQAVGRRARATACTSARYRCRRARRRKRPTRFRTAHRRGSEAPLSARSLRASARSRKLGRRSSASSAVLDARNDSLFLMTRDSNPLAPFSTRNALTPSSVAAQTTATSASAPFVIQCFAPSSVQSAPCRRARVRMRPGSEPPCDSVNAKQPSFVAARELRQPSRALLLRAERMDRTHDEAALHRNAAAHAAVAALELLADEAVRGGLKPGAAVTAQSRAEQSELGEARNELDRETFSRETLRDDRRDLSVDEPARRCRGSGARHRRAALRCRRNRADSVGLMESIGRPGGRPTRASIAS